MPGWLGIFLVSFSSTIAAWAGWRAIDGRREKSIADQNPEPASYELTGQPNEQVSLANGTPTASGSETNAVTSASTNENLSTNTEQGDDTETVLITAQPPTFSSPIIEEVLQEPEAEWSLATAIYAPGYLVGTTDRHLKTGTEDSHSVVIRDATGLTEVQMLDDLDKAVNSVGYNVYDHFNTDTVQLSADGRGLLGTHNGELVYEEFELTVTGEIVPVNIAGNYATYQYIFEDVLGQSTRVYPEGQWTDG